MKESNSKTLIQIPKIAPKFITMHITGDTDIVLNKMDDRTKRDMVAKQKNLPPDNSPANYWERVITSIHWLNGEPCMKYSPSDYTEELFEELLNPENDSPCISAYGFRKQCSDAAYRFKADKSKVNFMEIVSSPTPLFPIRFAMNFLDEDMVPTKTINKVPVLSTTSRFSGWSSDITLSFFDNIYSPESIINIVNLTGYAVGIGSRKMEGFGRFHVEGDPILSNIYLGG